MPDAGLDTDVLLKVSGYGLPQYALAAATHPSGSGYALAASAFAVRSRLKKITLSRSREAVASDFEQLLTHITVLEPTETEAEFAAEIEATGQKLNLPLDTGESQLVAVCLARDIGLVVTGDKRAVKAFELIAAEMKSLAALAGRLLCLEQLFTRLLALHTAESVRDKVCSEPTLDKAMTICFSCSSSDSKKADWLQGLTSYIRDLRASARNVLSTDDF